MSMKSWPSDAVPCQPVSAAFTSVDHLAQPEVTVAEMRFLHHPSDLVVMKDDHSLWRLFSQTRHGALIILNVTVLHYPLLGSRKNEFMFP